MEEEKMNGMAEPPESTSIFEIVVTNHTDILDIKIGHLAKVLCFGW